MAERVWIPLYFPRIFLTSWRNPQEDRMICKLKPGLISLLFCVFLATLTTSYSQKIKAPPPKLPTMREQAEIQQQWLKLRLERALPELMRSHNVTMWLVICREYNEDPAF